MTINAPLNDPYAPDEPIAEWRYDNFAAEHVAELLRKLDPLENRIHDKRIKDFQKKMGMLEEYIDTCFSHTPTHTPWDGEYQLHYFYKKLTGALKKIGNISEAHRRLEEYFSLPIHYRVRCCPSDMKLLSDRLALYTKFLQK